MTIKLSYEHNAIATVIRIKSLPHLCEAMVEKLREEGFSDDYIDEFIVVAIPDHVYGKMVLDGALEGAGVQSPAVFASIGALAKIGAWAKLPDGERGKSPLDEMLHFMTADGDIVPAASLDMDQAATHAGSRLKS